MGRHAAPARRRAAGRARTPLWPFLLSFVLVMAAVAGGLARHQSRTQADPQPVKSVGPKTPDIDPVARAAAVDKVLKRRAQAVLSDNQAAFLADVDQTNPSLLARQRTLFSNLKQFGFAKLAYQPLSQQYDEAVTRKYGPSTYIVAIAMTYQIRGIDAAPVRSMLGYTFRERTAGRWTLVSDQDLVKR